MKFIFVILTFAPHAAFADETSAKQKSVTCNACHGEAGISPNELWPNLAGQKHDYLVKQLIAFRDGVRIDPLMTPVSKMLSTQDIEDLAVHYSQMGKTK